ncbi:hypothetical protein [Chryseobacterium gambrini]|nr:hypothetical protein [Chryseobacterium gambrini]
MKKSLLIFFLMLFGLCFSQVEKDLYGKWMGVDQGEKGFVTFYPDGFISFNFGSDNIDGKNFIIPEGDFKGKVGQIKYKVDFSKKPFKITLITYFKNGDELISGEFNKGLIEFTKKDEILFYMDTEQKNPAKIDPLSPDTMLFKKESDL